MFLTVSVTTFANYTKGARRQPVMPVPEKCPSPAKHWSVPVLSMTSRCRQDLVTSTAQRGGALPCGRSVTVAVAEIDRL